MALITHQAGATYDATNEQIQQARRTQLEAFNAARTEDGETPGEGTQVVTVRLTQAQYDAADNRSDDVLYVITDAEG